MWRPGVLLGSQGCFPQAKSSAVVFQWSGFQMLLWVLKRVDPDPRTSLGKYTSSFLSYRRGSPSGHRGGRYPSIPIKPPSSSGWARPQPERLALVALSPLLPPAPDKCVISGCSLMETSRGGCQWDKYSSAFLLSCGSSG